MVQIEAGFLIVRTFEELYRRFAEKAGFPIYAIPRKNAPPTEFAKQYRGIDREALVGWSKEDLELGWPNTPLPSTDEQGACLALSELEHRGASEDGFIFTTEDAFAVYSQLRAQRDWEIIWAAREGADVSRPIAGQLLGFEPTWFGGDHFSALCDCMCFPRWHGTDQDGTLFLPFYERLNQHALFDTAAEAGEFLQFYRSQEWTETREFVIAQVVWLPNQPLNLTGAKTAPAG